MHTLHKYVAAVVTAAALALVAAPAQANHIRPNMGIEVTSVDPATRTVVGIQHCTSPDQAGRSATFTVTPDIEFNQFMPGAVWGIAVKDGVILSTGEPPCSFAPSGGPDGGPGGFGPGPGPGPGGPGDFGPPGPGGPGMGPDEGSGFAKGFLNRVWKFEVEIDDANASRMSVTIGKLLNLPKRFAAEEESIVDQDAAVLLGKTVKVFQGGKRVTTADIADADTAKVQGKLLPQAKWVKDEDDLEIPTIRAKRVYLP